MVALTRFGGYSDTVYVPVVQAARRPEGMGIREASALPVNYLTAYQLMVIMGGVREADTVLVHSAGGGGGIAERVGSEPRPPTSMRSSGSWRWSTGLTTPRRIWRPGCET